MKYILLLFAIFFICNTSYSQKDFHGIGPYSSLVRYQRNYTVFVGISYSVRVNVYERENFSVSLGIPFCAGLSLGDINIPIGGSTGGSGDMGDDYSVSIPLVANFNWGAGSTKSFSKNAGYFVGGGLGYLYDGSSIDDKSGEIIRSIASTVNGGVRLATGKRKKKNIELKLTLTSPFQKMEASQLGFSTIFNL